MNNFAAGTFVWVGFTKHKVLAKVIRCGADISGSYVMVRYADGQLDRFHPCFVDQQL